MPLPRKPHPKRRVGGSRSSRRRAHEKAWITAKLLEKFQRMADLLEQKRQHDEANAAHSATPAPPYVKEKAPDLTAEGFSSFFRERQEPSG